MTGGNEKEEDTYRLQEILKLFLQPFHSLQDRAAQMFHSS
jgi:hypothetical protein